jgi:hypothetical protein
LTINAEDTLATEVPVAAAARRADVHDPPTGGIFGKPRGRETLRRITRDGSVRAALSAFVLTRVLVIVVIILTAQFQRVATGSYDETREVYLSLTKLPVSRLLRHAVLVADVNWYLTIVEHGYTKEEFNTEGNRNWAFFPLHPLLWSWASSVTGEYLLTGMTLVAILLLLSLILLHKTVLAFGYDEGVADRTVFYLAAFPVSYFFSLPLTESLFLFLTVASFYAARREHWWLAAVFGALASATRVTGVLLLPALILLYWQTYRRIWPPTHYLVLFIIPSGLFAFMCYLYTITGNAFAFKDVLVTWGRRPTFFLMTLIDYFRDPFLIASPWDFRLINYAAAALVVVCGIVLVKWRAWSLAFYTLASSFVALSSGLLQSQARYAMVVFPVFITLAAAAGKRPRLDQAIRTASLVLLCLMTLLFAMRFTIVMS